MAHQFSSGVFCYNKPAWHRLGIVVDGTLPAREAFRIANADFQVAGRPVFDADMQLIPGYQAITRMDTGRTLSVMTETYAPIQNESLIRIAEALHEDIARHFSCLDAQGHDVLLMTTYAVELQADVGKNRVEAAWRQFEVLENFAEFFKRFHAFRIQAIVFFQCALGGFELFAQFFKPGLGKFRVRTAWSFIFFGSAFGGSRFFFFIDGGSDFVGIGCFFWLGGCVRFRWGF
jgi:hypothetical protein